MKYRHKAYNLAGQTIETQIDLSKVVAIQREGSTIEVYCAGITKPIRLLDLPAGPWGTDATDWEKGREANYTALIAAWNHAFG